MAVSRLTYSRQQPAGSRQQAAGSRQQPAGSRQQAAGGRQQAAGSRQQAAGSRQLATGSRQPAAGRQAAGQQQAAGGCKSSIGACTHCGHVFTKGRPHRELPQWFLWCGPAINAAGDPQCLVAAFQAAGLAAAWWVQKSSKGACTPYGHFFTRGGLRVRYRHGFF